MEAVLRLDGQRRFAHFIKMAADTQNVWGLWKDGWALSEDDSGTKVFPLWPAREYADACRVGDWAEYEPSVIPVEELLSELLPKLRSKSILTGVFPTPSGQGVTPDLDTLAGALREELAKYE
jgi:hypothetical protein